jgi:hypothetical protein
MAPRQRNVRTVNVYFDNLDAKGRASTDDTQQVAGCQNEYRLQMPNRV